LATRRQRAVWNQLHFQRANPGRKRLFPFEEIARFFMKFKLLSCAFLLEALFAFHAAAISLDDIQLWAGSGTNRAALVIEWSVPKLITNSTVSAPITDKTLVWGYQFNGSATGLDMLDAVQMADPRLYSVQEYGGDFITGLGYNLNGNGLIGVTDGIVTNYFTNGVLSNPTVNIDAARAINGGDLYWGGFNGPNWELWNETNDEGGFFASPIRGTNEFLTPDDPANPYSGSQGQWEYAQAGLAGLSLTNGSWIGFSVAAAADIFTNNNDTNTIDFNFDKHAPASPDGTYAAYVWDTNDFAVQVVSTNDVYAVSPYNDPGAVLGRPTLKFIDYFTPDQASIIHRSKIVEPPYWTDLKGNDVITEINAGGQITVAMGRKIYDNPNNPYGIDFMVYGNSFYVAAGFGGYEINDFTDEGTVTIPNGSSGIYGHPTIVSVSQDGTNWYTYPYVPTLIPENAYRWDDANHSWTDEPMNANKPLNPALNLAPGVAVANALDQYNNACGGTGYDLKQSGFPWIQYIRLTAGISEGDTNESDYTVIDSVAAVNPVAVGDTLTIMPSNLVSGVQSLAFQRPDNLCQTYVSLSFQSVSDIAKVSTVSLSDFSPFAPVPGIVSSAFQIQLRPVTGTNSITAQASIGLRVGDAYHGDGSDLRVYGWMQTNWVSQPFVFDETNSVVLVEGLTNFSAFVVSQIVPPQLQVQVTTGKVSVQLIPVPNCVATLERSPDLRTWTPVTSINPTNAVSVMLEDNSPPPNQAFYRLKVNVP
jgi:hypothetical protein